MRPEEPQQRNQKGWLPCVNYGDSGPQSQNGARRPAGIGTQSAGQEGVRRGELGRPLAQEASKVSGQMLQVLHN